ncbi:MAG: hypothetical protein OEY01_15145 [Desulfobulbaceae bacterium]|nr:hypothetical protein [Desulfobulbaceae bacterium]HIJ79923.1 hypothetical protein [Deltaproteobacteria bacterium]
MKIFLITLLFTAIVLVGCGLLVNFCKKRLNKTPHGLSGMCQKSGGEVCTSCAEQLHNKKS